MAFDGFRLVAGVPHSLLLLFDDGVAIRLAGSYLKLQCHHLRCPLDSSLSAQPGTSEHTLFSHRGN